MALYNKKRVIEKKFFLLFVLFIIALSIVKSQECIIPADGITVDETTIFCKGAYDLQDGIFIGKDNINLDCSGAELTGFFENAGITISRHNNITITNCNISGFGNAFSLEGVSFINIRENNMLNNLFGVYVTDSNNTIIIDNLIQDSDIGIIYQNSPDLTIENNNFVNVKDNVFENIVVEEAINETIIEPQINETIEETTEQTITQQEAETFFEGVIKTEHPKLNEEEMQKTLSEILDSFWKTQSNIKIIKRFVYNATANITEVRFKVVPLNVTLKNYSLYINIDKCAALYADMVAFKEDYPFEVIERDPIYVLPSQRIDKPLIISYEIDGEILEECRKLLKMFAIEEELIEPPEKAIVPTETTAADVIRSAKENKGEVFFAFLAILLSILLIYLYERLNKTQKIKKAAHIAIDIFLLIMIAANFLELIKLLPPYLDWLEKLVGLILLGYLLYNVNLAKRFFGYEKKWVNLIIIIVGFLLIINVYLSSISYTEGQSRFLSTFNSFLLTETNTNVMLLTGGILLVIVSLYAAFAFENRPGLMHDLSPKEAKPMKFLAIFTILSAFSYIVFKRFTEWLGLAADAPILMFLLGILVFYALKHHRKLEEVIEVEEKEERFYKKFLNLLHAKRTAAFAISGLLALHPLMDIFVFILPYLAPLTASEIYFGKLEAHASLWALLSNEISSLGLAQAITAYSINVIAVLFLLVLPIIIWHKKFRKQKTIFPRWLLTVFFASFIFHLLIPAFKIKAIKGKEILGVDIISLSILETMKAPILNAFIFSVLTGIIVFFLYKHKPKAVSFLAIIFLLGFFSKYIYLYLLSNGYYFFDAVSHFAIASPAGRFADGFKFWLIAISLIFYVLSLFVFIYEIFFADKKWPNPKLYAIVPSTALLIWVGYAYVLPYLVDGLRFILE